jgi:hypothetical protein
MIPSTGVKTVHLSSILGPHFIFPFHQFFLIGIMGSGVQLSQLGTTATNWPIVPTPVDLMMEKLVE